MGRLTPPGAEPVITRYWNTTETVGDTLVQRSHCHIVGERLTCCGLDIAISSNFESWTEEPKHALDDMCKFVVDAINKGATVTWKQ